MNQWPAMPSPVPNTDTVSDADPVSKTETEPGSDTNLDPDHGELPSMEELERLSRELDDIDAVLARMDAPEPATTGASVPQAIETPEHERPQSRFGNPT